MELLKSERMEKSRQNKAEIKYSCKKDQKNAMS